MKRFLMSILALAIVTGVHAGEGEKKEGEKKPPVKKEKPGKEGEKKTGEKVKNPAAAFTLPDPDGKKHSLSDYKGKWVVLEWVNHGCPYVTKHYKSGNMQMLQKKYAEKGVVWLSICSSAPGKQGHYTAKEWKKVNKAKKTAAKAVLLDPGGVVGRKYRARTTPQMVVVNPKGGIVYDGAIDDNRRARTPEAIKAATNYVSQVLDAVLAGKTAPVAKTRPYGCSVKYK